MVLNDAYMYLKMIFVFATGLVYVLTIILLFLFVWYARDDLETMENLDVAGYLEWFQMSDKQVNDFIGAWYLAIPLFGWFILNGLRTILVAQLAPGEARAIFERLWHGEQMVAAQPP